MASKIQTILLAQEKLILNPFQIDKSLKLDVFHHARVDTSYVGGITKVLEVMKIASTISNKDVELQSWSYLQ